jgi:hypothetical protein
VDRRQGCRQPAKPDQTESTHRGNQGCGQRQDQRLDAGIFNQGDDLCDQTEAKGQHGQLGTDSDGHLQQADLIGPQAEPGAKGGDHEPEHGKNRHGQ